MYRVIVLFVMSFLIVQPAASYQETKYQDVMTKLEAANPELFKMAKKVYKYATTNTKDIIEYPLRARHNKGLNGVIDLKNKVSAKYFAVGQDGLKSRMVMLFKFGGEKFKVVENYVRDSKFSKWKSVE